MLRVADKGFEGYDNAMKCINNDVRDGNCKTLCPNLFVNLPPTNSNNTAAELASNAAAKHYNWTSISYSNLIQAIMKGPARGNLSECEVFARLYNDMVHPRVMGTRLLTDLLVTYMDAAMEHVHSHEPQQFKAPPPINPNSLRVPSMRCFGSMGLVAIGPLNFDEVVSSGFQMASYIDVAKATGWQYHEHDEGRKPKPGWISHLPNSTLWISIDAHFGNRADSGVSVSLAFLASWEHMGRAEITCKSGCSCANSTYEGHVSDHQHSISKFHEDINLVLPSSNRSQTSSRCIIQIKVLPETLSGGHKVKLMHLTVKTWVNASEHLNL